MGPDGSVAQLGDASTSEATFVPDASGTFVIELRVDDGLAEDSAQLTIAVLPGNTYAGIALVEGDSVLAELPVLSFDAAGHQESLANELARIASDVAAGRVDKARRTLVSLIERVDGWTLRGAPDPKGAGQPFAADHVTERESQEELYEILRQALEALED